MTVKRFSLITFWEVSRNSRRKPWPEETLRLVCKIMKTLLCGSFLEVACGAYGTCRCFSAPIRNRSGLRCGFPSLALGLPSEKLHQQVLESCAQDEVTEGGITEASSSICAAADVRLTREELVLKQCHGSSIITQINPSIFLSAFLVPCFYSSQSDKAKVPSI